MSKAEVAEIQIRPEEQGGGCGSDGGGKKSSGDRSIYPGPLFTSPNNPPVRGQIIECIVKDILSPCGGGSAPNKN